MKAQAMPLESLEAIRLLTNLETEKRKLLQIVLFGQPELNQKLQQDSIRQLNQRITFHYHLGPLRRDDMDYYLSHRLNVAGFTGGRLFSRSAANQLYAASGGIPRLVNIVAHKALMLTYGEGRHQVSARHVRVAAKDTGSAKKRPSHWWILAAALLLSCRQQCIGMGGATMSVINQMLQDLENRHSAREADASISAQLRAVPKRSRIHPAWWAILLLALTIVAGMLVWRTWSSKDAATLASTAAGALATQEKNSRDVQHSLQPRPSPVLSQHALPDLKLAMQISAAQDLSSVRLQATENRPLPAQQTVVPVASRVDPVRPAAVSANSASPQPDADSGKSNPVALAQTFPAPGSRVDTGRNTEVATAAVAKQIKEITPQQRAENEYGKAISLLQQGRTTEAIELLGNVLQFDPGNTAARQTLVGLLVAGKRYGEAERSLRDGLKLNPGQTGLAMILCASASRTGGYSECSEDAAA